MKIFRFDADIGQPVRGFGSHDVSLSRILRTTNDVQIGCFYGQPGGVIALHQAVGPQLLLVVQGQGWIRGKDEPRTPVHAGQTVYWKDGERRIRILTYRFYNWMVSWQSTVDPNAPSMKPLAWGCRTR